MILNRYNSEDGKSLQHNIGSKGSICRVRVGSRSCPLGRLRPYNLSEQRCSPIRWIFGKVVDDASQDGCY
ncbi:hypothetical protein EPR50_G00203920 [Perca flavescens]|uniref:Uncharacterized protein n=1 Tax=Perca flavescens TaxID=8167 RepID=A0A484CCI9_PERFV|nr:hypothetical protein EPR50_G00203920 [Perca flavescens]